MQHSVPDAIFYSSQRLAQGCSNFGVAHSLEVCHFEGNSLLFRERLQSVLQGLLRISQNEWIGLAAGSGRRIALLVEFIGLILMTARRSYTIDGASARNGEQPGERFSARGIVPPGLLPYLPKHFGQH